ncbi:hypothetical protein E2C01_048167 [Portunus trituberculatus]|uniref:Uncharacterized protein n=1 Tax=Portunus trituberculatus TaxID=210409 RepID=A0A5B7G9W1_PORTR|nr:hypothetical protein [Portunus trituberculatus]
MACRPGSDCETGCSQRKISDHLSQLDLTACASAWGSRPFHVSPGDLYSAYPLEMYRSIATFPMRLTSPLASLSNTGRPALPSSIVPCPRHRRRHRHRHRQKRGLPPAGYGSQRGLFPSDNGLIGRRSRTRK